MREATYYDALELLAELADERWLAFSSARSRQAVNLQEWSYRTAEAAFDTVNDLPHDAAWSRNFEEWGVTE